MEVINWLQRIITPVWRLSLWFPTGKHYKLKLTDRDLGSNIIWTIFKDKHIYNARKVGGTLTTSIIAIIWRLYIIAHCLFICNHGDSPVLVVKGNPYWGCRKIISEAPDGWVNKATPSDILSCPLAHLIILYLCLFFNLKLLKSRLYKLLNFTWKVCTIVNIPPRMCVWGLDAHNVCGEPRHGSKPVTSHDLEIARLATAQL